MSGHSKWASIKHKKGAVDAKRGKAFTKLIKEISVSARMGGGDIEANPRLRTAVFKAKVANMPKDNIDRAIKKGTGELEGVEYQELTYEAYGPGGTALLIEILTDNKNRTAAELRHVISRGGGNLGESGCVSYMFKRRGLIALDGNKYSEDDVMELALEAGAEDITTSDNSIEVLTGPDEFESILEAFDQAQLEHTMAEVSMLPDNLLTIPDEKIKQALRLIESLEDHDDVQSVATNLDIPDGFELED